jgi:ribosome-binding ATPase YchF (GTP1/OBG family)
VAISSRIESELAELPDDEAGAMRAELGISEAGLDRVVREAYALLQLIAFFTAGEAKPAQSWHLHRGLSAWHAAGEIHSDIQRGFVRAEVIGWKDLVDAGGYAGGRERGTLRLEAELSELDDEDAAAMRADLGVAESGLHRVVRGAFELLELLAFFTAGEAKPAQSWHLRRGLTAWHAAGEIHSDIQKGFVRAEVIGWDALVDAGGYAGARDRGTLRLEGRDYAMRDGDVLTVKFTP